METAGKEWWIEVGYLKGLDARSVIRIYSEMKPARGVKKR